VIPNNVMVAAAHQPEMSVEQMEHALQKAAITSINLQTVVFEPETMHMHVAINHVPAWERPYVDFDLRQLFRTPALGK